MKIKQKAKKRIKNSKKTKMFLLFLGLSFLIWFPIKLSKLYTDAVYMNIVSESLPEDKLILEAPTNQITVSVEQMSGFDLLRNRIATPSISIDLKSLRRLDKNTHYLLTDNLVGNIRAALSSELKLIDISPDTLFYELGVSKTKKVPVVLDLKLSFASNYGLVDGMVYTPKEISISGPENIMDTITSIKTSPLILSDVRENITKSLAIQKFLSEELVYDQDEISILGTVEKFTESRMKLPFEILNLPANTKITTIPTEVEVVFNVPLSLYKNLKPTDFAVVCDFNRSKSNNLNYLIPEFKTSPDHITGLKILPEQIEFFITE